MRILGLIRLWHTHRGVGGMQGHALNLYSALAKRGHTVDVLTTTHLERPTVEVDQGVTVHYLPGCTPAVYSQQYFSAMVPKIAELESQGKIDVIHSESDCGRYLVGGPIPVVATWHGVAYCSYRSRMNLALLEKDRSKNLDELNKTTENILNEMSSIPKYNHSIAISHQAYDDLRQVYGVPANKVSLVFNGFDTNHFKPDTAAGLEIRKKHKIPTDAIVLGVAGRIVPDKGHRQLTALLHKLINKNPKIHCLIVGEGPLVSEYIRLGSHQIIHVGPKSYSEMPKYYNAFDIFVNPTTRYLGLDMSIQEAMLCGIPVIASDVGSIKRSLLPDNKYGLTFSLGNLAEFYDKILFLAEKSDRTQMGKDARRFVETFCSVDQMCSGMERVFKSVQQG